MRGLEGPNAIREPGQQREVVGEPSEQGLAVAMYKLANLYTKGNGVPKDLEFAYVWYSVGATHEHEKSINMIEKAKSNLSSEELASANQLIAEYVEKYGPKDEEEGKTAGNDPATAKK